MDIDKIFEMGKKRMNNKAPVKPPTQNQKAKQTSNQKVSKIRKLKSKHTGPKTHSQTRMTEDGFRICKEDDLNLGVSKNGKECPFDCDCCF